MKYQIDTYKIMFLNMLSLQEELNIITNGEDYKLGFTQNGDPISWTRCIVMESFELNSFTKWKHWEDIDGVVQWNRIEIEIIDILHFILSYLLQYVNIDEVIDNIVILCNYDPYPAADINKLRDETENLIYYALMIQNNNIDSKDAANVLLEKFFLIVQYSAIHFDRLYNIYVAKNRLNLFRQKHGYKEGIYNKIWNDKKDLDIMLEILKDTDGSIDKTIFYDSLLSIYKA